MRYPCGDARGDANLLGHGNENLRFWSETILKSMREIFIIYYSLFFGGFYSTYLEKIQTTEFSAIFEMRLFSVHKWPLQEQEWSKW